MGDALQFAAAFSAAIVAGGLTAILRVWMPTLTSLSDGGSVRQHEIFHWRMHSYMLPAAAVSALSGGLLLVVERDASAADALNAVGLGGAAGVLAISVVLLGPINKRVFAAGAEGTVPPGYHAMRDRWIACHAGRTVSALAALAAYLAAAMIR